MLVDPIAYSTDLTMNWCVPKGLFSQDLKRAHLTQFYLLATVIVRLKAYAMRCYITSIRYDFLVFVPLMALLTKESLPFQLPISDAF